ncbi:hypothetical protein CspeluHIS016_0304480 [Cutaneotrichosporon spelunceum]|uniref:Uncharacterized protein n=1 Tax=Cutaneotrichosporon spelunceum TaxID=1672016 RepID=A0AAD3TTG6_9TREE|nr:hypothetical protein CspeluHIS016_0304480 [Cutaneotrichosporon spelunceum]
MVLNIKPVVSPGMASCCTVLSFFGVIILSVFGYFFAHRAYALTSSEEDPKDPDFVAKLCYTSAVVYAVFMVFCGLQLGVHSRYPRGVQL